jgi:hypothetical protein
LRRTVEKEMKNFGLTLVKAEKIAQYRDRWRALALVLCTPGYKKD